jgi:LacI family transcriptional regulator, gluconate utilization system Gnt-I transcriptional repressor
VGKKGATQATSMKDVARLAGVSTMTVSRAMRSPGSVSPQVLENVRAAIEASGYVPNRIAGSLSSNRSTIVALVVPSLRNALYAETIKGISEVLTRNGLHLMISDSGFDLDEEEKLVAEYISLRVCGVILHNTKHTPRTVTMLRNSGIPCVETGNLSTDPIDMVVSYSNHAAGKAMARHLLELGYERMAFASLPVAESERLRQRRNGFLAELRRAGKGIAAGLVLEVEPGLESGSRALAQIVEQEPSVQAVFFAGDVLAAGAIFECQRRGIAVPERIAVAASDDNELMQNMVPPITTVAFPRYEIGVRSASMIVARTKGVVLPVSNVDVGFEVIRRGST